MTHSKSKVSEITGENLEDLLAYDDLFLDYFNVFLSLPVFPKPLVYNRLTGGFHEVEEQYSASEVSWSLTVNQPLPQYGPTDAERDNMLEWARQERLPTFLHTQLFREFKLLKLLLRPLDNNHLSVSHSSSLNLRGYSRATGSYVSSLSVSGDNSGNDIYEDDMWGDPHYSALYRYERPGSRALSLPALMDFCTAARPPSTKSKSAINPLNLSDHSESSTFEEPDVHTQSDYQKPGTDRGQAQYASNRRMRQSVNGDNRQSEFHNRKESLTEFLFNKGASTEVTSVTENIFLKGARVLSAPVNYEEFLKIPRLKIDELEAILRQDDSFLGGQTFVQFDATHVSEEQTEAEFSNLTTRLKLTAQEIKEHVLGSYRGFEEFREFLHGSSGEHLLSFWLECELFKDLMEECDDSEVSEKRNTFFRNIQSKFSLKLTKDALEQISRAANNPDLSHTLFLKTQYDVLRRLRAYWVPRYLIHWELTLSESPNEKEIPLSTLPFKHTCLDLQSMYDAAPFFSCISLVHSVPVPPEDLRKSANLPYNLNTSLNSSGEPAMQNLDYPQPSNPDRDFSQSLLTGTAQHQRRFVLALELDQAAGSPFKGYLKLSRSDEPHLLNMLRLWQDVGEYAAATRHPTPDRMLRLSQAWTIYNTYLSEDGPRKIELPPTIRSVLLSALEKARDFIDASVFEHARFYTVEQLEPVWIRFLKEDLKAFLDCQVRSLVDSPPSTAEVIQVTLTENRIIIKRPMPWIRRVPSSTPSERALRLHKAFLMADNFHDGKKALRKLKAAARKKEWNRRKTQEVRSAYSTANQARSKKISMGTDLARLDDELPGRESVNKAGQAPHYETLAKNKPITAIFRKFVVEGGDKELSNKMQLYHDIDSYFHIQDPQVKKAKAALISRTYLDPQSKKFTQLNNETLSALTRQESSHLSSQILQEIQQAILPDIETVFTDFVWKQANKLDVHPNDLVSMSQSDISKLTDNQQHPGLSPSKHKNTGRAQATREDKTEFLVALDQCAVGQPTVEVLYFYKYLLKHSQQEDVPQIYKDLFFYIEVQKFKDACRSNADHEILMQKVKSIVECFLDSVYLPALQVDIPAELHQKTLKAAQRCLNGKEVTRTLFDDAQFHVFKELLFFWAGFKKSTAVQQDPNKKPVNKYEKMLHRRKEKMESYVAPSSVLSLPPIPQGAVPIFSISLSEGVRFKFQELDDSSSVSSLPILNLKQ